MLQLSRRQYIAMGSAAFMAAVLASRRSVWAVDEMAPGMTRGVVLYPFDLTLADWPARAAKAGINTIALHAAKRLDVLADYIQCDSGLKFLEDCKNHGIAVEFELHAMGELLSRELYHKDPTLFRKDERGNRNGDANCNPFSTTALDIIAEKAVKYAKIFAPTTGRYFFWPDDGANWDCSSQAEGMNASEQALLVENHIIKALRKHIDPNATLSHISYSATLAAPTQVNPEPGMFLEFAPIQRDFSKSIANRDARTKRTHDGSPDPAFNGGYLDILQANMKLFGANTTQVLEYWLDVSLFSSWTKPSVKLPWNEDICRSDVAAYRQLGVKHITTFAANIDADYVDRHGDPQEVLNAYGRILGAQ